jgi:outer membrane protein TolC
VIFYENEFAKAKLSLQRAIGVPLAQSIQLTDAIPCAPLQAGGLEDLIRQAYDSREDLKAEVALVHAAESNRQAALGIALPSIRFNADLGKSSSGWDTLHNTYQVAAAVTIPLFQGGRVRGRMLQADAQLRQQQAQLDDLRARVDYEVRSAWLDAQASDRRVQVARSAADLAAQQLAQAQDRFAAGVTSNIEVVQAQEAVATSTENYLSALFSHNLAKISLARAIGVSEERAGRFLGGK